jgi:hypothetical protein
MGRRIEEREDQGMIREKEKTRKLKITLISSIS